MAVTVNNVLTELVGSAVNTITESAYTIPAGSSQVLLAIVATTDNASTTDGDVTGVTYDGNAMTLAAQEPHSGTPCPHTEIWYVDAPAALAASGDVVATTAANINAMALTTLTLNNAAQGGPEATATAEYAVDPYADSITTATNNAMIIAAVNYHDNTRFTPASSQNEEADHGGSNMGQAVGSLIKATAGSQEISWTSTQDEKTTTVLAA